MYVSHVDGTTRVVQGAEKTPPRAGKVTHFPPPLKKLDAFYDDVYNRVYNTFYNSHPITSVNATFSLNAIDGIFAMASSTPSRKSLSHRF